MINAVKLLTASVATFLFSQVCLGQGAEELSSAAIRLKQAHVMRSYEKCLAKSKSDDDCRKEIEELHPREIAALASITRMAESIDEHELSASVAACYDSKHDYLQLLACWEKLAADLQISSKTVQFPTQPAQIEAPSLDELEDHIIQQLKCRITPEPVFALLALERLGKINRSEMIGYDSISCFKIHGGIEVRGLKFSSVCGHSEDGLVQELFPDLLWRGPGTSPGQFISFGTDANFETTSRWYVENLFFRQFLNQAIETENTFIGDRTNVTCSSWMLN